MLAKLIAEGGDPAAIVESEGLAQISDAGELESVVEAAIEAEPEAAEAVRGGNAKAAGRIMGRVMKETQGRADGGEVNRMILQKLGSLSPMAWNVVIAGGGFAGSTCAHDLEKLLPVQSARLALVNDVNFMLYTPFLPEAAAGLLEPRHVVTPLREILSRTYLRLGAVDAHDPVARTVELRGHDGETEQLRYDQLVLAVGSVSRTVPIPGLDEHAIGFKGLADAIWLRNHVVETLELANASEDPARREQLLTYVFVGGGYAGLEALAELQDFAADAIARYPRARLHGMRWILVEAMDRVLPEIDRKLADYAVSELRGRGIEIRLGTQLEEVDAASARLSTGESVPTRTVVWTAGVRPHPSLANLSVPLDAEGGSRSTNTSACEGCRESGRSGTAPPSPIPPGAPPRRRRSTGSGRRTWWRATSPPRSAESHLGPTRTRARRPSSTSAATRRSGGLGAGPSPAFSPGGWPAATT